MTKPPLWLLVFIVGLPQFAETVYSPSLPEISHALGTSHAMVEHTLSIYLFAFSLGTLMWGPMSDMLGRKLPLLCGFFIYVLGCIGCYLSSSIEVLLLSRFVQAFGGSAGSTLGQVILRDAFSGNKRSIAFSTIGAALSISPAIGPLVGGWLAEFFGFRGVFAFLVILGGLILYQIKKFLYETHPQHARSRYSLLKVMRILIKDPKVLIYGALIGGMNGIMFSYYGEGSFYLIEMLGLSPSAYGASFILLSIAAMIGAKLCTYFLKHGMAMETIIWLGLSLCFLASFSFLGCSSFEIIHGESPRASIHIILLCMILMYCGINLTRPSILSNALEDYQPMLGTASALFVCYYYLITSLLTFIMATIRNGSLIIMPLYFLILSLSMLVLFEGLRWRGGIKKIIE